MLRRSAYGGLLLALVAWCATARGAEPVSETSEAHAVGRLPGSLGPARKPYPEPTASHERSPAPLDATTEQIRGWIKDLDSDKFSVREAATEQLLKSERAAIDALTAAVESKSPEVSMRAMRVLEELYQGKDTATRVAAQKALAAIAAHPGSPGAKRANEILSPPNITPPPDMAFGGGRGGRGRRMGGGGGLGRFANLPPGTTSIQTRIVNGHKTVDADNGPRKVHIEEDPQGAIIIRVTEMENGQEQTRNFAAKNLEDLTMNKSPEARQLYQQYMAGVADTRIGPFQFRSGAIILDPAP